MYRFLLWMMLLGVASISLAVVAQCGDFGDNTKAVRDALNSTDPSIVSSAMDRLSPIQRQSWLSDLHQRGGYSHLSGAGRSDGPAPGPIGNGQGGAAIANYTNLMNLIESTITPDAWQAAGGTSTMIPFRQGVRIDPNGVIERVESVKIKNDKRVTFRVPKDDDLNALKPAIALDNLGSWQEPTKLRWISLHQLDRQLVERRDAGAHANIAMELLGGIYRIDYIAYDNESKEWFLGGPAGGLAMNQLGDLLNKETMLPPVLLEDLLGVSSHVLRGRGELGCSIDPVPERLAAAYAMAQSPSTATALQRNPDKWTEEWRAKLGRQKATIVGFQEDSPTGYALLVADAHMKRLGLGLELCPTPMKSYWDEAEALGQITNQGMVRWWFSLSNNRIPIDPQRKIYSFEESNVEVLSETQLMNGKGERVVANAPDIAADAFARGFTKNFATLQKRFPIYGRLRHIFDLSVAMEIVRSEIENGNGLPLVALRDPSLQPRMDVAPRELESVAASKRLRNGSITALISGGVSINVHAIHKRTRDYAERLRSVAVESSPGETNALTIATDPNGPKPDPAFWR